MAQNASNWQRVKLLGTSADNICSLHRWQTNIYSSWEIAEQNEPFLFRQLELRADSPTPLTPLVSGHLKLRTRPILNTQHYLQGQI